MSNSRKQPQIPHALVGVIGAMALLGAPANAAESSGGETGCSPAAMQAGESEGSRVVYAGPRRNVKKNLGDGASGRDCVVEPEAESRVYFVGPRHNVRKTSRRAD